MQSPKFQTVILFILPALVAQILAHPYPSEVDAPSGDPPVVNQLSTSEHHPHGHHHHHSNAEQVNSPAASPAASVNPTTEQANTSTSQVNSSAQAADPSAQQANTQQLNTTQQPTTPADQLGASEQQTGNEIIGDHPDWRYQNGVWIQFQQDHMRLHSDLAMSVYGNYAEDCPKTFPHGFNLLGSFSGGYMAHVPDMKKVIIVFKGVSPINSVDLTPVSMSNLVPHCPECTVAAGVMSRYLALKAETQDFAAAKAFVAASIQSTPNDPILFSTVGHGWGGAISALCGIDLGSRNLIHFSHTVGVPRFMNYAAVVLYDNLFQFLAGQSVVNKDDYAVHYVPRSNSYYHVGQKARLTGDRDQYLTNCFGNNENVTCLGAGTSQEDHLYYFTPLGTCGTYDSGF